MKLCPQCDEQFDDRQAFCDQDGAALVDHTDAVREALQQAQVRQSSNVWITGTIGGFIGVIICVLLYGAFLAGTSNDATDGPTTRTSQTQEPATPRAQLAAAPAAQNTPVAEEEPSPEEEASPSPSPAETVAPAPPPLNTGPIATGTKQARESEKAIIRMKDGSSVEADAAWEDAQGIWYRRSGLVSFVEKSRVEAITDPPQRQAAKPETKTP